MARQGCPGNPQSGRPEMMQSGYPRQTQSGRPGLTQSGRPGLTQSGCPCPEHTQSGYPGPMQPIQSGWVGNPGMSQSGRPGQTQSGRPGMTQSGYPGPMQSIQSGWVGNPGMTQTGRPGMTQSGYPGPMQSIQSGWVGNPGMTQTGRPGQTQSQGCPGHSQSGRRGMTQSDYPGPMQSIQSGRPGQTQSQGCPGHSQSGHPGMTQSGSDGVNLGDLLAAAGWEGFGRGGGQSNYGGNGGYPNNGGYGSGGNYQIVNVNTDVENQIGAAPPMTRSRQPQSQQNRCSPAGTRNAPSLTKQLHSHVWDVVQNARPSSCPGYDARAGGGPRMTRSAARNFIPLGDKNFPFREGQNLASDIVPPLSENDWAIINAFINVGEQKFKEEIKRIDAVKSGTCADIGKIMATIHKEVYDNEDFVFITRQYIMVSLPYDEDESVNARLSVLEPYVKDIERAKEDLRQRLCQGSPGKTQSGYPAARTQSGTPGRTQSGYPARTQSGYPARTQTRQPQFQPNQCSPASSHGSPGYPARTQSGYPARTQMPQLQFLSKTCSPGGPGSAPGLTQKLHSHLADVIQNARPSSCPGYDARTGGGRGGPRMTRSAARGYVPLSEKSFPYREDWDGPGFPPPPMTDNDWAIVDAFVITMEKALKEELRQMKSVKSGTCDEVKKLMEKIHKENVENEDVKEITTQWFMVTNPYNQDGLSDEVPTAMAKRMAVVDPIIDEITRVQDDLNKRCN